MIANIFVHLLCAKLCLAYLIQNLILTVPSEQVLLSPFLYEKMKALRGRERGQAIASAHPVREFTYSLTDLSSI